MQISYKGKQLLKELEGFRQHAYLDSGGVWTIGYGTTKMDGKPVEAGQTVTEKEAQQWLASDLAWAQTAVNKLVKVKLSQNMFDALTSFVYNIGESAFAKSTLLQMLNMGMYREASQQFKRWVYDNKKVVKGLVTRRLAEQALFEERA